MITWRPTLVMQGLDAFKGKKEIGLIGDHWQEGDPVMGKRNVIHGLRLCKAARRS